MKKGLIYRVFIYFLSISFLLLMNGFHQMVAQAKERNAPIGEMVSKGEVKFEAKENVWKKVEASHFPIFQGMKVKTEKGMAAITLSDSSQIEVGENSLFAFDLKNQLHLHQGNIQFRIQSNGDMGFKVGNVSIKKSLPLQASKGSSIPSPKPEEAIGSITLHANGSVTVKSLQGSFSILDQDRVVLAGLSSRDTLTLPSTTVKSSPKVMVAQAGETGTAAGSSKGEYMGLSTWTWVGIGVGVAVIAAVVILAASGGGGSSDRYVICP